VLFALFSAPFWFAGVQLAGQAFGGALSKERFAIGRNKFRLAQVRQGRAGRRLRAGVGGAAAWLLCLCQPPHALQPTAMPHPCPGLKTNPELHPNPKPASTPTPIPIPQELAMVKNGVARFLGQGSRSTEGDAADLSGARVVTTVIVNGVPRHAIEVVAGVKKYRCAGAGGAGCSQPARGRELLGAPFVCVPVRLQPPASV
jgi:hypothetical protein